MSSAPVTVDMNGKRCVVTGANTGIGKVTALELARAGARVVLACRSREKAEAAMADIRAHVPEAELTFARLDLASLASVRECADDLLANDQPIHVLVNNAGLAGVRGLTEDGFELIFGINHLGPYLLTRLLLERIIESAPARIVCVSSRSHYDAKGIDLGAQRKASTSPVGLRQYSVSKLANVLFASELARRLKEREVAVTTYSLHPGVIASDIWRKIPWPIRPIALSFMSTNEEGARTSLYCATSPECADESGLFYDKCKTKEPSKPARDVGLAAELWHHSAEWVGLPA